MISKLTFGPTPGLADAIENRGIWEWIDDQLDPAVRGVPDVEARLSGSTTLANTHRQNYDVANSTDGWDILMDELDHATILRAVSSERQLYELMCDFWANHFNTWRNKTWMAFLKTRSHQTVVRAHALGKFSDMLVASTHDTSMLDYLDNLASSAADPAGVNENYARELLELHTLGIVNGQQTHTEADVAGVAKLVSGWSIEWSDVPTRYDFKFLPWQHDRAAVSVLGGLVSRPARAYGQGYADGVALVNALAHHPATATHIAWKLCRRFVSDTPSESLVASTAAVFSAHDTAIAPTLRHIFASEEFAQSAGTKVRRPFEAVVGGLRALQATLPDAARTQTTGSIRYVLEVLGQPIFERPSPDGYPDVNRFWLSSEGLLQRWSYFASLARSKVTNPSQPGAILISLTSLLPTPAPTTAGELVDWFSAHVLRHPLSAAERAALCTATSIPESTPATTVTGDPTKFAFLVGLLMCHPRFQHR